jgi:hypothetical protein
MDKNRELAELLGMDTVPILIKEWGYYHNNQLYYSSIDPEDGTVPTTRTSYPTIPDFAADPRLVLREMMKRTVWPEFRDTVGWHHAHAIIRSLQADVLDKEITISGVDTIHIWYILNTTGLLRDKAIEFLKERKP